MNDVASIIRLTDNQEIIAIIEGIYQGNIKTKNPYYIRYNDRTNSLGMMPYCPLSDEEYYEFDMSEVKFCVIAKNIVTEKYLEIVNSDKNVNTSENDDHLYFRGNELTH